MGMRYNVTFHNARISPERYAGLIGWTHEAAIAKLGKAAELAREYVCNLVDAEEVDPVQDENGIDLSGCGYWDHASYFYRIELERLLSHCEPGAYIHEIDDEELSGEQWRLVLYPDGSIRTIRPVITWPDFDANDLPIFEKEDTR